MINVGCGNIFHPNWINMDIVSRFPEVIEHDLTKGWPFDDESIDVCYSSHVLEHLRKDEADYFVSECKRVLKSGGVLRLVVPDLEAICRNYFKYLNELVAGNVVNEFRYDYSILEMFDQVVRERPGGELGNLWSSGVIQDMDFVLSRGGLEALEIIERKDRHLTNQIENSRRSVSYARKIKTISRKLRLKITELVVALTMGKEALQSFRQGMFRNTGEIHRVMYDRYSLARLFKRHGFLDIKPLQAHQSQIDLFFMYQLDVVDGTPRKPDSIYMEAVREN